MGSAALSVSPNMRALSETIGGAVMLPLLPSSISSTPRSSCRVKRSRAAPRFTTSPGFNHVERCTRAPLCNTSAPSAGCTNS
jgi:hypothetical protein